MDSTKTTSSRGPIPTKTAEAPFDGGRFPWTPILMLAAAFFVTMVMYSSAITWMVESWRKSSDNSHGPLVLLFSAGYLWYFRDRFPAAALGSRNRSDLFVGVGLAATGLLIRMAGMVTAISTLETVSLIPFIAGLFVIVFGCKAGRWAAPAIVFLFFMIPLPGGFMGSLSGTLQSISTKFSVVALQMFGIPAVAQGNVIQLSEGTIGVAQACSGIRMLYAFIGISVAACLVTDRSYIEKALLLLSAIPIALLANCIRVSATGLAYEHWGADMGSHIFHDLAGMAMVPLGVGFVWIELKIASYVFINDPQPANGG